MAGTLQRTRGARNALVKGQDGVGGAGRPGKDGAAVVGPNGRSRGLSWAGDRVG